MDKKKFIEIKATTEFVVRPWQLALHMLKDLCLFAVVWSSWKHLGGALGAIVAIPALAVIMFRNFSLMHDAVHGAVTTPRWLNEVLGVWSGVLCLLPYEPWKKVHLQHHVWAGNVDKDPVMMIINAYPTWPLWLRNTLSLFWKAWMPLVACLQYSVFWLTSFRQASKEKFAAKILVSIALPLVGLACLLAVAPMSFTLGNLLPGVFLYLLAVEVVNLPHHLELPQYHGETKLPLWEQHKIARSCVYPKWFAENVVLNFNYHLEHHLYPGLAWYHLPKVQQMLQPELGAAYNTDPQFSWILKNRPKNLEDVFRAMEEDPHHHLQEAA